MKVVVADGARHRRWTGYGSLSRSAIRGLARAGAEVILPPYEVPWDLPEAERTEFTALTRTDALKAADIVLTVGTPTAALPKLQVPSVAYTQNALGDLPIAWQQIMSGHAAIVVPGQFDLPVFRRYYPNVHVVPQVAESQHFKPVPKYRHDIGPEPTLTFVGSWGYRKGTDLLMTAAEAALDEGPARLRLFLGVTQSLNLTDLVRRIRSLPRAVDVEIHTKVFAPVWMARFYNQSDLVVTLSRGEGWCMPLHEALLCGVPVVAPDSTAMGEYLPSAGVVRVPTTRLPLSEVPDKGFRERYETPSNYVNEPDPQAAIDGLRLAVRDRQRLKEEATDNLSAVRARNEPILFGAALIKVLDDVLAKNVA